jgi:uncharacterized membrane protein
MLENLRDEASFKPDDEPQESEAKKKTKPLKKPKTPKPPRQRKPHRSLDQVTGMTAQQRFILAAMLLVMVCLLGTMLLLLTGKIFPAFLS